MELLTVKSMEAILEALSTYTYVCVFTVIYIYSRDT